MQLSIYAICCSDPHDLARFDEEATASEGMSVTGGCRFRYDVFPSVFNTGDLTWYPPDYRRAVVPNQATEEEDELAHEPPLPTSIMLTPLDSPPRATDAPQRQQQQQQEQLRPGRTA